MIELLFSNPLAFFILFPGLMVALTVHEFAHAWTADYLGDPTPRYQGRVTLDPRAHLDPLGTVAILLTGFGWGRPVEFDPYNLKHQRRDTALIALAGPASNLVSALLFAGLLASGFVPLWLSVALGYLILINLSLAIFNLVPVYPLDGSKILLSILPKYTALEYDLFMQRYGMLVLLALLIPWAGGSSPISQLISPIINIVFELLV